MERKVIYFQMPAIGNIRDLCLKALLPRKMGDSCPKAHLHISVEAEVFISRKRVEKSSMCRPAQSIPMTATVRCASSWLSHPGSTSSWLHVVLAPWMKIVKSPGAGMPEGCRLYLLKSVPRILTQTCCLSMSYMLVRVSTGRSNVKRMMGWVTIPTVTIFLLQASAF